MRTHGTRADILPPQKLQDVKNEAETRKRGFPKGDSFKLVQYDITLVPDNKAVEAFKKNSAAAAKNAVA